MIPVPDAIPVNWWWFEILLTATFFIHLLLMNSLLGSSLIGVYHSILNHFITHYPAPQDNANRCDVRWFSMCTQNNEMIKITGLQPLCFRAWPYSEEDLENSRHNYQLPIRDFINLNIDLNIHGVGGDDSWAAKTMKKYTNPGNKSYNYGFILEYEGSK